MKRHLIPALAILAGLIIVVGCKKRHHADVGPIQAATPIPTPTSIPTAIPISTAIPSPTATLDLTQTFLAYTATVSPTNTNTPTITPSASMTGTPSPSPTPSDTPQPFGSFWGMNGANFSSGGEIFWSNIYHHDPGTDLVIGNNQVWGPGYPRAYSVSDINAKNRGNYTFTDCNEDSYYFSNVNDVGCDGIIAQPVVDWAGLKTSAQNSGCDWSVLIPIPAWYSFSEQGLLFKPGDSDYPGSYGGPDASWAAIIESRLITLQTAAPAGCGITGSALDNEVVYIDTSPGGETPYFVSAGDNNHPKTIKQSGSPPKFRGSIVTAGELQIVGSGGSFTAMSAPAGGWIPSSASMNVNFQGLIVTGGDFGWAGNPVVYGSIIVFGDLVSVGGIKLYGFPAFPYSGISGGGF